MGERRQKRYKALSHKEVADTLSADQLYRGNPNPNPNESAQLPYA